MASKRKSPTSSQYYLYASDGTNKIYEIDYQTWNTIRAIDVVDKNGWPVYSMNELEIIKNGDEN